MMKINYKIIIWVLLSLVIVSPVLSKNITNSKPSKNPGITAKIKGVLSPRQNSYTKMKPIKFSLKLSEKNKPVENANVSMNLTMMDMYMPKNEVKLKETSKGNYEAEVMFTMSGNWQLINTVIVNNKKQVIKFDVAVD